MPAISAQQLLAIGRGLFIKNLSTGTNTQVFSGIPVETVLTPGVDTLFVNAATSTTNANIVLGGTGVQVTTGILPGMVIKEIGTKAGQIPAEAVVFSVTNNNTFVMGTAPQYVVRGLKATLSGTDTNIVNLTEGVTDLFKVGYKVTKSGAEAGAFGNGGTVYIKEILSRTSFSLASDVPDLQNSANHATQGAITFDVGGYTLNGITGGNLDIRVGGVDFANNAIPGLGDLARRTYTLPTTSTAVNNVLVYLNGGDITGLNNIENIEKDYHTTGLRLQKKLK